MDREWTVKEIFESKPEGSRMERPRMRWLKDAEKYLREMKVKRWRKKGVDRGRMGVCNNNNNNNNNIIIIIIIVYLLQLGCYPVAVAILHVNKT